MRILIVIGLLFCGVLNAQNYHDFRKPVRIVYGGDTTRSVLGSTNVDYTTNLAGYNFDKPILINGLPINTTFNDTLNILYIVDMVKFVLGGWVKNNAGSAVQISPNGAATMNFTANTEPVGLSMSGVQSILFPTNSGYQDYMQGFTNDTSQHTFDTAWSVSKAGVMKMIDAYGGGDGMANMDSIIKTDKSVEGIPLASVQAYRDAGSSIVNISSNTIDENYAQINIGASEGTRSLIQIIADVNHSIADTNRFTGEIYANDSVRILYAKPLLSGTRFGVITSGAAIDTGVLNAVRRGLEDKIWNVHMVLNDKKNGEIRWIHIDDVTGDTVSTYGLPPGMDSFEALQYAIEMLLRLDAEKDIRITKQDSLISDYGKRLALLERKEYRMNRQDYKYKAKLLKLENRLK